MIVALNAAPAAVLLAVGVSGCGRRRTETSWLGVAALLAGVAAIALAVPDGQPPVVRGYIAEAALVAAGASATAVFRVGCALSPRRPNVSPVAVGGAVAVLQVLLIVDGNDAAVLALAGQGPQAHAVLLVSLTYLWAVVACGVLAHAVGSVLRFLPRRALRAGLRAGGVLVAAGLAAAAALAVDVLSGPTSAAGAAVAAVGHGALVVVMAVLGLGLLVARVQAWLRPAVRRAQAVLLHYRLGPLEQQLTAAAPEWEPTVRTGILGGPEGALYSRVMTIWDTTRALTTDLSNAVVAGSIEYAQLVDRHASPSRHAAVAEACLLHHALNSATGDAEPRFNVRADDDGDQPHDDIGTEGRFLCAVADVLDREQPMLRGFERYLDETQRC